MKVTTDEKGAILLENVFNPIILKTNSGEELIICMRDSGFEFSYQNEQYSAKNNIVEKVSIGVSKKIEDEIPTADKKRIIIW